MTHTGSNHKTGPVGATAANFYISTFYHHVRHCGLDADGMLADAGIDAAHIDNAGERTPTEKLANFIIAICDALQDESMALAKHPVPRGTFYMMGKLTVHEATLEKALAQMQRFMGMVTRSFKIEQVTRDDKILLTCNPTDPEFDPNHLFCEMNLMMLHRFSSWLIAENIPLCDVYFSYPPPQQVKEYTFLFPGRHVFHANCMGFTFSRKYLEYTVAQNTGTLKTFMRNCPQELFSRPKTDFSLTSEVHSLLYPQDRSFSLTLEQVAETLFLTRRTLIRRLQEEGSSFQQIKDMVRRDRAIYYLTSSTAPIGEIAGKIGFSDASVFTRAFKTWTGSSPREYRARRAERTGLSQKTSYTTS